jgi:hypothetical protein
MVAAGAGCMSSSLSDTGAVPAGKGVQSGPDGTAGLVAAVFAHSATTLYRVDPETLGIHAVAQFSFDGPAESITDLAVNYAFQMVGISFRQIYIINPHTAHCTATAGLDRSFNGLSFVKEPGGNGPDILLATAEDGAVYRLDPMTGNSTPIGNLGGGLTSSGDVVSVNGFGTVATVKRGGVGSDLLASIDTATGAATVIGETGFTNVWGLGFWKGTVFGFTKGMQFIAINPKTGAGTLARQGNVVWWGAGVTTAAPVVH